MVTVDDARPIACEPTEEVIGPATWKATPSPEPGPKLCRTMCPGDTSMKVTTNGTTTPTDPAHRGLHAPDRDKDASSLPWDPKVLLKPQDGENIEWVNEAPRGPPFRYTTINQVSHESPLSMCRRLTKQVVSPGDREPLRTLWGPAIR
jgi:hypothetical protein